MNLFESKPEQENKVLFYIISIILVLGVIFCIYTPNFTVFKWWARFSSQISIGYWILGILFLAFKKPRLTMVAFVSCLFLCLYLRNTTNTAMVPPKVTDEPIIRLAQFNMSASNSDYGATLASIKKTGVDIVSVQEVTPEWRKMLNDSLSNTYPYSCELVGLDVYSMKLFSKFPFSSCDTFYCGMIPNLALGFKNPYSKSKGNIYIIASYIAPPIFSAAYLELQKQLDTVSAYTKRLNSPAITIGDYNIHASSYEIQQFRRSANLNDSRRGYRPDRNDGYISLLEVPTDHIFYTPQFNCIEFQTISGPSEERLGIKGYYQFCKDSISAVR